MWQILPLTERSRRILAREFVLRLFLLIVFFVMNIRMMPRSKPLTEEQLNDYKRPPRDSYVPSWLMTCTVVGAPLLIFSLPWPTPRGVRSQYDLVPTVLAWTLAMTLNAIATEIIKLAVGRPRPDFFYRCFPEGVITGDQCSGSMKDIIDGRKSFPSGHTSVSFCSLGFVSFWLCGRLSVLSYRRLRQEVVLCLIPLFLASVIGASRYIDHHHHRTDVLGGSIVGFFVSYFCYRQYFYPFTSMQSGIPYPMP